MSGTGNGGGYLPLREVTRRLGTEQGVARFAAHLCGERPERIGPAWVFTAEQAGRIERWLDEVDPGREFHGTRAATGRARRAGPRAGADDGGTRL